MPKDPDNKNAAYGTMGVLDQLWNINNYITIIKEEVGILR